MAVAQAATAPSVAMKPVNVALFKNGYGFVTLQGTLPEGCTAELAPLPVPTLGTFWIEAGQGVDIARTVSSLRESKQPAPSVTPSLLAASNPDADVNITLKGGIVVAGKIMPFSRPETARENPNIIGGGQEKTLLPQPDESFFVKTVHPETCVPTVALINPSEIVGFELLSPKVHMPSVVVRKPVVTLELKQPAPGGQVRASCLARGITWHPSYKLALGDNGKAMFEAKATIVNNLTDVENVSLELITGFPSLEYAGQTDPMALFARTLVPGMFRNGMQAINYAGNMAPEIVDAGSGDSVSGMKTEASMPADGVQSEDLFFYPVAQFSARAGDVVALPLFAAELDYQHVYTWDVTDPSDFARRRGAARRLSEVWHCIRMKNTLSVPLTKAPVEFTSQNRIAGQNTMPHTPAGGDCTIKMNKAVNVAADQSLNLVKREKYRSLRGRDNYRTENEVGLSLENGTGKDIVVEIRQRLNGVVSQASDGAKTSVEVNFNDPENPSSTVQWTLHLKPGERKTVSYHYLYVD